MRKLFENQTTQSEKTIRQEARDQYETVELNERQLDMVAGGIAIAKRMDMPSTKLFTDAIAEPLTTPAQ